MGIMDNTACLAQLANQYFSNQFLDDIQLSRKYMHYNFKIVGYSLK